MVLEKGEVVAWFQNHAQVHPDHRRTAFSYILKRLQGEGATTYVEESCERTLTIKSRNPSMGILVDHEGIVTLNCDLEIRGFAKDILANIQSRSSWYTNVDGLEELLVTQVGVPKERASAACEYLKTEGSFVAMKSRTDTGVGCVIRFEREQRGIDGVVRLMRFYTKIGDIEKSEANMHRLAHRHPLGRVIVPKLESYHKIAGFDVLTTYGTQNRGVVCQRDIENYKAVRRKVFAALELSKNDTVMNIMRQVTNDREIARALNDIFNSVLFDRIMGLYKHEAIYRQEPRPVVLPWGTLLTRAKQCSDEKKVREFAQYEQPYKEAVSRFKSLPASGEPIPINANLLRHNRFRAREQTCAYAIGDLECIQSGLPEETLARLGTQNNAAFACLYVAIDTLVDQHLPRVHSNHNPDLLFQRTDALTLPCDLRDYSFMISMQ